MNTVKKLSDILGFYLKLIMELFNNEERVIETIQEMLNRLQYLTNKILTIYIRKNGSSLKSLETLKELFFSENQKKLICLSMTPQFLSKHLAKMPAVKSYTNDGNLVRPKVNTEAIKDLGKIAQEFRIVVQTKKLQLLQAFEIETEDHVADYMKLRERVIDQKLGDERMDLLRFVQAIESHAAMTSDGDNFGLNGYAQIYSKKFQFDRGCDFDKEERAVSENINNIALKIRNRFGIEDNQ